MYMQLYTDTQIAHTYIHTYIHTWSYLANDVLGAVQWSNIVHMLPPITT